MHLLILIGILVIIAIVKICECAGSKAPAYDKETLDAISKEMTGKSQQECAKILKKYRKQNK